VQDRLPVETPFAGISVSENQMNDPYDLQRFHRLPKSGLRRGLLGIAGRQEKKPLDVVVFPQIEGLGFSPLAANLPFRPWREAAAYLQHPVLGPRLAECTELVKSRRRAHD